MTIMRMFLKRLRFLFSKRTLPNLAQDAFAAFGSVSVLIQTAWFFISRQVTAHLTSLFAAAITISLLFAIMRSYPRLRHSRVIRSINVEISIMVGDLFDEFKSGRSNIVIGSNTRFTPSTNRDLSQSQSLRASVARMYFDGRWDLLDRAVLEAAPQKRLVDEGNQVYEVPMGSILPVPVDGKKVFFVVNQERTDTLQNITKENYWDCLSNLWIALRNTGSRFPLAMPVLGSGSGRLSASRVSLIQLVLLSFVIATREATVTTRLMIVVQEKEYSPEEFADAVTFIGTLEI